MMNSKKSCLHQKLGRTQIALPKPLIPGRLILREFSDREFLRATLVLPQITEKAVTP
jgi:hypothetical protein